MQRQFTWARVALLLCSCSAAAPSRPEQRSDTAVSATPAQPIRAAASPPAPQHSLPATTHQPSAAADAAHHREACARGEPVQCHAAALDNYYRPRDSETDRAAFQLFTKACDAGYAPSCNGLGVLFAEGRGTAPDPARAAQLYRDACVAGAATGCEHLATALSRGLGVARDETAAARARTRAQCVFTASLSSSSITACPALLGS